MLYSIGMKKIPKFVVLGPQGGGKGTQSGFLAKHFHVPHISAGDELRAEIASGSRLGKQIASVIDGGGLLPSTFMNSLMKKCLTGKNCLQGWISDGYPRQVPQAIYLQRFSSPTLILLLYISDSAAIKRLSGRRVCANGHIYHIQHHRPTKKAGYCDHDGLRLKQRVDDTPKAIRKRLKLYHAETEPVISWYQKKGMVVKVDAHGSIHEVYQDVLSALEKHSPWLFSPTKKK